MTSSVRHLFIGTLLVLGLAGCATTRADREACLTLAEKGFRPIAGERAERFLGKVQEYTARCRGGDKAVAFRATPWVDWANYWATGDVDSKPGDSGSEDGHLSPMGRGIDGALLDLGFRVRRGKLGFALLFCRSSSQAELHTMDFCLGRWVNAVGGWRE